eukprot:13465261-Alexandrium_andersonii.AAC.1
MQHTALPQIVTCLIGEVAVLGPKRRDLRKPIGHVWLFVPSKFNAWRCLSQHLSSRVPPSSCALRG